MAQKHYLEREFEELMRAPATIAFLETEALDGLWFWDLENPEHEWMSPGFWRTLGYDPTTKQHLASEWQSMIFSEDGAAALENFQRHLDDPNIPYDQIVRYHTADGGIATVRCRGFALRTDGVPTRMLGAHTIMHDTGLHAIDQTMSELLTQSGDPIVSWSEADGITQWNKGAANLYGFSHQEALGQNPNILLQSTFEAGSPPVIDAGSGWSGEVTQIAKSGATIVVSSRIERIQITDETTLMLQIDRDVTALRAAQVAQTMLTRELNHRVKNLFAVVNSIVRMSAGQETDVATFSEKVRGRVAALAAAHSIGIQRDVIEPVLLSRIIGAILAPFHSNDASITVDLQDAEISQQATTPLALVLNELCTNATKYGAWSEKNGTLAIRSEQRVVDGKNWIDLHWIETLSEAKTTMPEKQRTGFGMRLINMSTAQLNGDIKFDWTLNGLQATLRIPIETDAVQNQEDD